MSLEGLEAILATIDDEGTKAKLLEAYKVDVQAEKDVGIAKYRGKDTELLKLKNAVKDTGYDSEKFGSLKEYVESLKTVVDDGKTSSLQVEALQNQLNTLTTQLDTEKKQAKSATIKAKLTQAIGKDFKQSNLIVESLMNGGKVDIEDGEIYFKNGDTTTAFAEGVKALEETYSDLLIVKQQGGDGGSKGNKDAVPDEQIEKLKKIMLGK